MGTLLAVANAVGPWGGLLVLWWLNMRWVDRQREEDRRRQEAALDEMRRWMQEVLARYKADVDAVAEMYRNNVALVEETQRIGRQVAKLAEELAEIVHLNTQVQTRLVEKIDNNMFCPMVRQRAAGGVA